MSESRSAYFVFPGDINTLTGGYRYDKLVVDGLSRAGWKIHLVSLVGDYPFPDESARALAAKQLASIPDNSLVIADGLAFSVLPNEVEAQKARLYFVALIHHPLALETGLTQLQASTLRALEIDALKHASHVITTSQHTADTLADFSVLPNKISVVFPGTAKAAIANGGQDDQYTLICVATLSQRKGHAVLLDALKLIEHLPWQLRCAGSCDRDRPTYDALIEQTQRLGLTHRVVFCGELSDTQLDSEYQQADLFVLASYYEGYGMVLDEAIARALPIVATRGGAIADTVPATAALLTTPGNSAELAAAIQRFIEDDTLRSSMKHGANEARQTLRTWEQAAAEFSNTLIQHG